MNALTSYDLALREPGLGTSRYTQYKKAFCLINLAAEGDSRTSRKYAAEGVVLLTELEALTRGRSQDRNFHEHLLLLLAGAYPSIGYPPSHARAYFSQRVGSRDSLYVVLDRTAKAYVDQFEFKKANTILANLADEIESPIVRGSHLLLIVENAIAMGDYDNAITNLRAVVGLLPAGLGNGAGELRQHFERQLREIILLFAEYAVVGAPKGAGKLYAAKLRDPKFIERTAILLKIYRESFPLRLAPVEPGSRDWNDAYSPTGGR